MKYLIQDGFLSGVVNWIRDGLLSNTKKGEDPAENLLAYIPQIYYAVHTKVEIPSSIYAVASIFEIPKQGHTTLAIF